jgi:synaptobrevin family protein YKT6
MKKNLNELLKREENLDNLMAKSKDLSSVSIEFYKKAKSANKKCCNLV